MRVQRLTNSRAGRGALLLALPVVAVGAAATSSSAQSDVHSAAEQVTNPFFPLTPGSVYRYHSPGKKTVTKVLKAKKTVQGRRSTVVDSKEYEGGKLTEHFVDYYFQGSNANVYYMKHKSRRSGESWTAGKSGAKRGIIMTAHPKVGRKFKVTQGGGAGSQKGGAGQDRARVYSVSKTRVKIKYTSRYYPETVRYIYKRGVGLYKILDKGETTTLTSFKKP